MLELWLRLRQIWTYHERMGRFLPSRKTVIRYTIISLILGAGFYFYTDDHDAPQLTGFAFENTDKPTEYEYSGRLTDARGVSRAQFECLDQGEIKLVIVVAMTGADRNKTSFGILSKSPIWSGSWKGTSYELDFRGRAIFPSQTEPISCIWRGKLRDNLGNEAVIENLQKTEIQVG